MCIFIRVLLSVFCSQLTALNMTDRRITESSFFIQLHRDFDSLLNVSEESRVKNLVRRWEEFGLNDIQLINYTVLISSPGSFPNNITDVSNMQCFLPSGASCDTKTDISINESFTFAAYSSVGSLEVQKKHNIICLHLMKSKVVAKSCSRA